MRALVAARFADCFHRLSQIRVWNDGNPDSQPRLTNVHVTDGCGAPADGYFSRLPFGANDCRFTVTAEVLWGDATTATNVIGNFQSPQTACSSTRRRAARPVSGLRDPQAVTYAPGANTVTIGLDWDDNNTTHNWHGQCKNGSTTRASTAAPRRRTKRSSAPRETPVPSCS